MMFARLDYVSKENTRCTIGKSHSSQLSNDTPVYLYTVNYIITWIMLALLLLSLRPSPAGDMASLFTTTVTGPSAMLT